jgi:hypothetical protein
MTACIQSRIFKSLLHDLIPRVAEIFPNASFYGVMQFFLPTMPAAFSLTSVAEPHHFYAAPAPGKNFDAAPAPTLLYSKTKFLKRTKV